MKKIIISIILLGTILYANNSFFIILNKQSTIEKIQAKHHIELKKAYGNNLYLMIYDKDNLDEKLEELKKDIAIKTIRLNKSRKINQR